MTSQLSGDIKLLEIKSVRAVLSARSTHGGPGIALGIERTEQKPHAEYAMHVNMRHSHASFRLIVHIHIRHILLSQS